MSSCNFLIIGLPRSRTAWMSLFMTTDNTICYHEPSEAISSIDQLDPYFNKDNYTFSGISDSNMGFFARPIMEKYKTKTLVIDRDLITVENSVALMGIPKTDYCSKLKNALIEIKHNPDVMWVPYHSLDSLRVLEKIWWHLMPGLAFDEDRAKLFMKMNIQVDLGYMRNKVAEIREQHSKLMLSTGLSFGLV
jgi:hypothetical protein